MKKNNKIQKRVIKAGKFKKHIVSSKFKLLLKTQRTHSTSQNLNMRIVIKNWLQIQPAKGFLKLSGKSLQEVISS